MKTIVVPWLFGFATGNCPHVVSTLDGNWQSALVVQSAEQYVLPSLSGIETSLRQD
jgi:hypothetical protein